MVDWAVEAVAHQGDEQASTAARAGRANTANLATRNHHAMGIPTNGKRAGSVVARAVLCAPFPNAAR
jgi:hypothetical protein